MSSRGPILIISNQCGEKTLPATCCCQPHPPVPLSIGNFFVTPCYFNFLFKVIWTDVFQLFFMFLSTAYIIAVATQQAGGPAKVRDTMVFVMAVTLPMMMK